MYRYYERDAASTRSTRRGKGSKLGAPRASGWERARPSLSAAATATATSLTEKRHEVSSALAVGVWAAAAAAGGRSRVGRTRSLPVVVGHW